MPYCVKAPAISITLPGQILEYESNTSDFEAVFVLMSEQFNDSLHLPDRFPLFLSVRNNPVISLGPGEVRGYTNLLYHDSTGDSCER